WRKPSRSPCVWSRHSAMASPRRTPYSACTVISVACGSRTEPPGDRVQPHSATLAAPAGTIEGLQNCGNPTMHYPEWIWHNGAIKRWEEATTHVMSHALH